MKSYKFIGEHADLEKFGFETKHSGGFQIYFRNAKSGKYRIVLDTFYGNVLRKQELSTFSKILRFESEIKDLIKAGLVEREDEDDHN